MSASNKVDQELGKTLLTKQFKELSKTYSLDLVKSNLYEWRVLIEGPEGSPYAGGYFPAKLSFPPDFPLSPPVMTFLTPNFWHPNVYADGRVCISILHEAKHDEMNPMEQMDEKWRPIFGVEAIIVSVLSMLSDPNFSSPAHVDASIQMKNDPDGFRKQVKRLVDRSITDLMSGTDH